MAIKKITGIPEIDAIANALGKKFGKDLGTAKHTIVMVVTPK